MNIRLYGRAVQVCRWAVIYTKDKKERALRVPTREEADAIAVRTGGTVTALDTSAYAWMDGIKVADVPNTYAEALKIYEMGEMAYKAMLAAPTTTQRVERLESSKADKTELDELSAAIVRGLSL